MRLDVNNEYFRVLDYPDIVSGDENIVILDPVGSLFQFNAEVNLELVSDVNLPIRLTSLKAGRDEPSGKLIIRFSLEPDVQTQYASLEISSTLRGGVPILWKRRVKVDRVYRKEVSNLEIYNSTGSLSSSVGVLSSSFFSLSQSYETLSSSYYDLSASVASWSGSIPTESIVNFNTAVSAAASSAGFGSGNGGAVVPAPITYFRKLDEPTSSFQDIGTSPTSGSDTIVPYNTWFKVGEWEGWSTPDDAAFTLGSRFTITTVRGVYDDPCANGGGLINLELKLEATGATTQPSGAELWDIVATQSQFIFSGSITAPGTTLFRNFYHLPPGQFMLGGLSESVWTNRLMTYGVSAKVTASDACVASSSLTGSINFDYLVPYVTNLTASAATTAAYQVPSNLFADVLAWYDFSNSDYYDTDGGSGFVTNFYHVLGGNLSGSFASGSRPYISSSMQNGLSTAFFSESWDAYSVVNLNGGIVDQEFTIFAVTRMDAGSHSFPGGVAVLNAGGGLNTGWSTFWFGGSLYTRIESVSPSYISGSALPTDFVCVSSRVSGATFEVWYNDYNLGPGTAIATPEYESLSLGRIGANSSAYMHGHIAEVMLYAGQLSDNQIDQVRSYLMNKWGIS